MTIGNNEFNPGDHVRFPANRGKSSKTGVIKHFNTRHAWVKRDDARSHYAVTPHLLEPLDKSVEVAA